MVGGGVTPQPDESSAAIRERVIAARKIQEERYKDIPGVYCNAQMTTSLLHKYAQPDAQVHKNGALPPSRPPLKTPENGHKNGPFPFISY